MKTKKIWIILAGLIVIVGGSFILMERRTTASTVTPVNNTVTIRPASELNRVSAAGNIALAPTSQQVMVLQVGGVITNVAVQAGDTVKPGDLLVSLDTTDLAWAVQQAQLNVATSQAALDKLIQPPNTDDVAAAQAALTAARKDLTDLQTPDAAQLAAAKSALVAAQAKYQDLVNGPSEAQKTQLAATFQKATVALQQAQQAYDKISYSSDVGMTQQAADLQNATIDYDTAKAAYDVATQPTQTDLQGAINGVATAQSQLDALVHPTEAQLADATAKVASAQATLSDLVNGPTEPDRRTAELAVEQAKLNLAQAQTNLERAQLRSPISGAVLAVNVQKGQEATAGLEAVTLADLSGLDLTVDVAQVDIDKLKLGQPVQITVDALPGQVFTGTISAITPAVTSTSGVVNYPVTIKLDNTNLAGIRAGMTAVATLAGNSAQNEWLVPTDGLGQSQGKTTVTVVQGKQQTQVAVTPRSVQGEWTVVQADGLKSGDQVLGSVTAPITSQNGFNNRPRGFFGGPPPGGGNRRPND